MAPGYISSRLVAASLTWLRQTIQTCSKHEPCSLPRCSVLSTYPQKNISKKWLREIVPSQPVLLQFCPNPLTLPCLPTAISAPQWTLSPPPRNQKPLKPLQRQCELAFCKYRRTKHNQCNTTAPDLFNPWPFSPKPSNLYANPDPLNP